MAEAKESTRNTAGALAYARAEHDHPSQDWTGYCQRFVRTCYGIPSAFSSAWTQWLGADDEDKHEGGDPADAPVGSALCYKGTGPYGHIMLAANPLPDGTPAAWSNDLVTPGRVDKVARTAPTTRWGQRYLGYLTAVNGYDLRLPEPKPRTRRYVAILAAADRLDRARKRAEANGEREDADVLIREVAKLRKLADVLRWSPNKGDQ